jgi:hypothetical protein
MKSLSALNLALGFMVALAVPAGYLLGSRNAQSVHETMSFLLKSDKNLEVIQNLKALDALKQNRIEETVLFMQTRVAGALKHEGIEPASIERAREYQRKYCQTTCLDVR